MFTTQEPTPRNISTCHIVQSWKIIFRDSLYILGENAIVFDLNAHYGQTIEALVVMFLLLCVLVDLGGLPWESQYYLHQEKNGGNDNCSGANGKLHF